MKPIVIINMKTYLQGKQVVNLAKAVEKVHKDTILGVQPTDIYPVCLHSHLQVFSEHVDPITPGRNTGFISPEAIKAAGAKGVFLNHSEHPLTFDVIKKTLARCRESGLKTAVFARDLKEAKKIEQLKPTYLIFEPPELVAGDLSVSNAEPEVIADIAHHLKRGFLVGAGIKTYTDLVTSIKLGAQGIAVSSAITTAKHPEQALRLLLGKI